MTRYFVFCSLLSLILVTSACEKNGGSKTNTSSDSPGLKIAFVNGDTVLYHFSEFRKESEAMQEKQRKAEEMLQGKGAALEKEIMDYQRKAQSGTMTGKEMEAREKYLGTRQEALMQERDKLAQQFMEETETINKRLKKVLNEKLDQIKEQEGYDFILSYVEGGAILAADEKYDITQQVLKALNANTGSTPADTIKK